MKGKGKEKDRKNLSWPGLKPQLLQQKSTWRWVCTVIIVDGPLDRLDVDTANSETINLTVQTINRTIVTVLKCYVGVIAQPWLYATCN